MKFIIWPRLPPHSSERSYSLDWCTKLLLYNHTDDYMVVCYTGQKDKMLGQNVNVGFDSES